MWIYSVLIGVIFFFILEYKVCGGGYIYLNIGDKRGGILVF